MSDADPSEAGFHAVILGLAPFFETVGSLRVEMDMLLESQMTTSDFTVKVVTSLLERVATLEAIMLELVKARHRVPAGVPIPDVTWDARMFEQEAPVATHQVPPDPVRREM